MYNAAGKRLGEVPFEDRFELRSLPPECCYFQFAVRDEVTGYEPVEINETTLYLISHKARPSLPKSQTREVLIDGVKYAPLHSAVIDRRELIRSLVEIGRGPQPGKSDDWFEDQAKKLYLDVIDSPPVQHLSVSEFVEALAARHSQ
jgi:hypothetical protein